jgi:hypothetical protein
MGLFDKIKAAAGEHGDKIAEGVDKATDAIDDKTGGKFSDHLDKVDDLAEEHLEGDNP